MEVIKTDFILNTVRRMENDQSKEFSLGDKKSLVEKLAIAFINPKDFDRLNLSSKSNLKISSNFGIIIVKGIADEDVPEGTVLMPISIWSNQITGVENSELRYKNMKVDVEITEEQINDLNSLINKIKEA
ncbi:MAG: molybdopterin dinucleotide binding domain-containing protein [Promethearchaeota archaeon]|jgi:formylmethanofuran dehydrogenase subunit D